MSQSLWWKECDHSVWEPQNGAHFQPHLINASRDLQNTFNFHFLSNIVRRKWKVAGQVVVKHSCQDRRVRFLFVHETSDSLQPQLPQVNHTKCHWLVSLKRGEEEEKHLHLWLLLSKLCSCEEFSELLPSRSSPNLCWCMGLFVHWCRTLHLCLLNFRILCSSHFSSLSGSFWMAAQHSGWTVHRHSQSCSAYLKFKRFPKLGLLPVNWWSCLEVKSRWINRFF